MRTRVGLGLQGSNLDLDAAVALGVKDSLLLVPEGVQGGDLQRLIELAPDCRIALRFYSSDRMAMFARDAAARDYEWLWANTTEAQRRHIVAVIPANELNLDAEHAAIGAPWPGWWKSIGGYQTINGWLTVWAEAWKQYAYHYNWHPALWWPALAPGHNPPGTLPEAEYELLRSSMAAYDAVNIHVYGPLADEWGGSGRLKRIVAKLEALGLGSKPRHVTEVNQVNFVDFCHYASDWGIEAVYWFLWRSAGEDHRAYDLKPPWDKGLLAYAKEGMMADYNRDEVWQDYARRLNLAPAFEKYRAMHPELGDWIDSSEYDVKPYRFQGAAGGLVYAKLFYNDKGEVVGGDWANVRHATRFDALPKA